MASGFSRKIFRLTSLRKSYGGPPKPWRRRKAEATSRFSAASYFVRSLNSFDESRVICFEDIYFSRFDRLRRSVGSHRDGWLRRLLTWLELFEDGFARQSQRGALRRYVTGLLSDSRRKSMEAMWTRLSDPGTYQAFQHFISHAPWEAEAVWTRVRAVVPERTGVLILDGTSFPKQGTASVGVARQSGAAARSRIADGGHGRVVDRWAGVAAGSHPVFPEEWLTPRSAAGP